jgi:hypothetical protein
MAIIKKINMKRLLITLIAFITASQVQAQLNASQIKKDGVTIVANSLNQIVCDTVNKIATKFDVASGGGGGSGTVTSVGTGLGLTGGTITTTGTISLDTASSVVLSRQRAANTYQPIGSYLTSVDTSDIANFYLKTRSLFSALSPAAYSSGIISVDTASAGFGLVNKTRLANEIASLTIDTTNISNFHVKTRSLFSATAPATYSSGIIGVDTSTAGTGLVNKTYADNTYETKSIYKVLESNGTSTNNVLVVASDGTNTFEFTADSASIYIIECWLNFTTTGASGVIFNISTTGTTTSSFSITGSNNSVSALRYVVLQYNTSSATFGSFTSSGTAFAYMQGSLITPGTGGVVRIKYRDNNAGQYVNAVAGSWMRVKKIK